MILLDTHAWLWWAAEPAKLSAPARKAMRRSSQLGVSVLSCWEAAMLAHAGRVKVDSHSLDWQARALAIEKVELIGFTPAMAVRAAGLQATRAGDPIDWMLVATAQELQIPLLTRDARIQDSGVVPTIW